MNGATGPSGPIDMSEMYLDTTLASQIRPQLYDRKCDREKSGSDRNDHRDSVHACRPRLA